MDHRAAETGATRTSAPPPESTLYPPRDRQLLEACMAGDPAAWDAFVDRFSGLLALVVDRTAAQRRVVLGEAERADLLADILLELIHRDAALLRQFTGRSTLATWLAVVSRRVVVRGLRNLAARPGGGARDESPPPASGDPDALLIRLHDVEGRSFGEISRITGMPLGAIGPALAVARRNVVRGDG